MAVFTKPDHPVLVWIKTYQDKQVKPLDQKATKRNASMEKNPTWDGASGLCTYLQGPDGEVPASPFANLQIELGTMEGARPFFTTCRKFALRDGPTALNLQGIGQIIQPLHTFTCLLFPCEDILTKGIVLQDCNYEFPINVWFGVCC